MTQLIPHLLAALFALLYVRQTLRIARLRAANATLRASLIPAALVCVGVGVFAARNLAARDEGNSDA